MGATCCPQAVLHRQVYNLPNQLPQGQQYQFYQSHSVRFSQITVTKNNQQKPNQYKFLMKLFDTQSINVDLTIINQRLQRLFVDNYELKIQKRMIIDIFNKSLPSTLVETKNQRTGAEFSLQLFTFKGYTSQVFKKCLYTLYILKKKLIEIDNNHIYYQKMIDNFVYGCNPDGQALAVLYQKAEASLANIAEYRKIAHWPWTTEQKLKIFIDIMQGVYHLHRKGIYHRDIRPSNIFFIQKLGRFVIGNFTKAIQLFSQEEDIMNRTVYGIEYMFRIQQGCNRQDVQNIGSYIKQRKQLAPYSAKNLDYYGLSTILQVIESCDVLNLKPLIVDKVMSEVLREYQKIYVVPFQEIRQNIYKLAVKYDIEHVKLTEDIQISGIVSKLTYLRHQSLFEDFTFEMYDILGYEKQFSDTTHRLIQKNNQRNKSLDNAYLLKNLGEFFQRSGAKGTQYYCNACLLFLKRTQKQLNLGNLQKAKQEYHHAEKCYIKFSQNFQSHSAYIELHRINSLIKITQNQKDTRKALDIIKETFQYAVKRKISIEKQMTLLLTYAVVHLKGNQTDRKIGEQKLKNGLAICENKGAFENLSSCNIHASSFLYQIGKFNLQKLKLKLRSQAPNAGIQSLGQIQQLMNLPSNIQAQVSNLMPQKGIAESNLKSCLQIREREKIEPIAIISVLRTLGEFYFEIDQFNESKKCLQRCELLLKEIQKQVNRKVIVQTTYLFASVLYALKEYPQAQKRYQRSLNLLSTQNEHSNELLKFNIKGNLGLAQMQMKKKEGQRNIQQALTSIKSIKSTNFFDYVFLNEKYNQLLSRNKKG